MRQGERKWQQTMRVTLSLVIGTSFAGGGKRTAGRARST